MASTVGRVFALTGAASRIGLSLCTRPASLKASAISIGDINLNYFEFAKKKLPLIDPDLKVSTIKVDVASSADVNVNAWVKDTANTLKAFN